MPDKMQNQVANPWNKKQAGPRRSDSNGETKFKEAQQRLQESVRKHLDNEYESSSEEEDLETNNILDSLLQNYSQVGGLRADLGRTQNHLENVFQSGAAVCLICIGSVKRVDQIWNCDNCFGFFHLNCAQRWAKDSIALQKLAAEERPGQSSCITWQCPKCRKNFEPSDVPSSYVCFCGQQVDPEFHPWLVPHSCGNSCNKLLDTDCGHRCLLLCHPGPCPPCPKIIKRTCFCGKGAAKPERCSQKGWSCDRPCGKILSCKQHKCLVNCHSGDCPPCSKQSSVSCLCGSQTKLVACSQIQWQCEKVCKRPFGCGEHWCEKVCHGGDCGPCPRSLPRSCPCGSTLEELPCSQEPTTCGSTCGKMLDCRIHTCSQRCHRGPCGMCLEVIEKECRCRLHKKEVSCSKEYFCEIKCKRMRDCRIHACNRKCCDGRCPPCEKPCGKTLGCGNHKCTSVCHRGPCYPCSVIKKVTCACGTSAITVPCGKRKVHPPKCSRRCEKPPDCDHDKLESHKCHFGDCPPCKLVCGKDLPCGHVCPKPCHSAVLVNVRPEFKPATPWEKNQMVIEKKALPCPPCEFPCQVICPGGHETLELPCYRAVVQPCGRDCGKPLDCGNHTCELSCHSADQKCEPCDRDCEVEQKCGHPCPLPCHPPSCEPCSATLKIRCHCGISTLFLNCHQLNTSDDSENDRMRSCLNQCPKNYPCGHRCTLTCHSGECSGSDKCRKKVKVTCPCKRIKKDFQCSIIQQGSGTIECDQQCLDILQAKKLEAEKQKLQEQLEFERRNKEELDKFEKKMHGKKKARNKRNQQFEGDLTFFEKYKTSIILVSGVVLAFLIYLLAIK